MSLDDEEYQQYRISLRGTRFDRNGVINSSAALRYHIQSVVEERKKQKELVTQQQVPKSDILQTNDEFITQQINKVLEIKQEETDEVIAKQEPEKQMKIFNYFEPINRNIRNRLDARIKPVVQNEQVKEQPIVMTEEDKALLSQNAGKQEVPEEVIEVRRKLQRYIEQTRNH